MHLYTLTGGEKGWWTVNLGGRVWLPKGELPFGLATDWGLVGKQAKTVGEWQGEKRLADYMTKWKAICVHKVYRISR